MKLYLSDAVAPLFAVGGALILAGNIDGVARAAGGLVLFFSGVHFALSLFARRQ